MYCCLKEKKTYKTSSIPIVNTDGQKKKPKKYFGVQGLWKKTGIFMHSEIW